MDDALLFIDANRYLDLYRLVTAKKLLPAIKEQQEHIFITKQVVDEVQRNKLREAARLRATQIVELKQAGNCSAPAACGESHHTGWTVNEYVGRRPNLQPR
jgi:hypothetical protein